MPVNTRPLLLMSSLAVSLGNEIPISGTFNAFQELANSQEILAEITEPKPPTSSKKSQEVVLAFYEALKSRDVDTVHKILARDLEWWFHGPPSHQFMMRLLTGEQKDSDVPFEFSPISITPFGNIVVAEGFDTSRPISWVHAWTVTDGIISQVREYFNTSLTVTRLGNQSQPSDFKSKSSSTTEITPVHCPPVWESSLSDQIGKSVPVWFWLFERALIRCTREYCDILVVWNK
ncbi:Wound-induced protein [Salix suchowensis]|nr:Wound-induced protein [Salix suchowensis]